MFQLMMDEGSESTQLKVKQWVNAGVGLRHCPLACEMPPTQGHVLHQANIPPQELEPSDPRLSMSSGTWEQIQQ